MLVCRDELAYYGKITIFFHTFVIINNIPNSQPVLLFMDELLKYFPDLTSLQNNRFCALEDLYRTWNDRINVISRRDIDNLYVHHVLHSMAIARFLGPLADNTTVLDMGTGGGFPGIPLAIYYPEVKFHLIDRIGKKIRVCNEVIQALGLKNVTTQHGDIGENHTRYDYVVSRAVMRLEALWPLVRRNISTDSRNRIPNGLICLKGGDGLDEEIAKTKAPVQDFTLTELIPHPFFETKSLLYVPVR